MAQILVRATVTAEGYCAGWVGYVDDTDPVVADLLAAGYLTTDAAIPPVAPDPCCLPDGGISGQVLVKESNLDRDAGWATVPGLGPAGGVLAGSYPDPTFAQDMATQAELDTAVALRAPLASPVFTGSPAAPTPTPGDNDTSIATTAFVTAAVTAAGSGHTMGTAAPTTGAHVLGETIYNSAPEAGGNMGWVCTTAGTPGTWKPWGLIGV